MAIKSISINMPFFEELRAYDDLKVYSFTGHHEGYFITCDMRPYGTSATIFDNGGHCLKFEFGFKDKYSMGNAHVAMATAFQLLFFCKNKPSAYKTRMQKPGYSSVKSITYLDLYGDKDIYIYER